MKKHNSNFFVAYRDVALYCATYRVYRAAKLTQIHKRERVEHQIYREAF